MLQKQKKNHEYKRKGDGQVSGNVTTKNVNNIHKQKWNHESSRAGEEEHSLDCLNQHIKRQNKAGNE